MPDRRTTPASAPIAVHGKAEGSLLALAAGDALGWPQENPRLSRPHRANENPNIEFVEWTRRGGGRFRPYEEMIRAGEYSDDTQLTLAVARSRLNHGPAWWKAFTRVELPLWTLYQRGGGRATRQAARAWADGKPPWMAHKEEHIDQYFDAGGNGVAMRVLPHALLHAETNDPAPLIYDVVVDGSATHGHPRALIGAAAFAYAAWFLLRVRTTLRFGELLDALIDEIPAWSTFPGSARTGGSWFRAANQATDGQYDVIWNRTAAEMRHLLETARNGLKSGVLADNRAVLDDLGCFGLTMGAGTSSAAAAAYLAARYAVQPTQGILWAAFETGADTDTLAAMTGGLMGCLSGSAWIPQPWLNVQDAAYLQTMASRIADGPDGMSDNPVLPLPRLDSVLSSLTSNQGGATDFGSSMQIVTVSACDPKPLGKNVSVSIWQLKTAEGQTLYVTKAGRTSATS